MPKPTKPVLSPYTDQLPDVNNPATWADRTPLFWNWVTGDGYTNMTDALAYSDNVADYLDTALAGSETLIDSLNSHYAGHDTYRATVGGTANAVTLTTAYSLTSIPEGVKFVFVPTVANTGTVTITIDGTTYPARTIDSQALPAAYLIDGALTECWRIGSNVIVDRRIRNGEVVGAGKFTQWASGDMTVTRNYTLSSIACTTARGSLFQGNLSFNAFPIAFSTPPTVQWNVGFATTADGWAIGNGTPTNTHPTTGVLRILSATSVTDDVLIQMTAEGRWYS